MAASTIPNIGLNMKLFRNTNTFNTPTWSEVKNVIDMKCDPGTANEVDVSSRLASGFVQKEPGLKESSYEWDMLWRQSDTDLAALVTAWQNGTLVEFAFADGAIGTAGTSNTGGTAGATYFRQECKIFSVARDEPLNDKASVHIVAKPCFSTNAPSYNTVT